LLLIDPETTSLYKTTTYFDGKIESIIDILTMNGTLPEGTKVLDFHTEGNYTSINLSKEFGDVYFGDSKKGELMLDSIIYTLSSYYKTYGVSVAIEGDYLDYLIPSYVISG
jgi:spore germination protein GerM